AMTYAGARGETAEQMAKTLHFPECKGPDSPGWMRTTEQFHRAFGRIIDRLNQQGKKGDYQLSIANALWGQKGYTFLDDFIQLNDQYYHAGLENVDFINPVEREKARQKINTWVEGKTNEKIKNLIPKGVLDELTRLVLTNAIYFKGDWAEQFDPTDTTEQDFFVSSDKTVKVPLMYQKAKFKFGQTETLQMLELPYKGDDLSMLVLLPKEKGGLADLEKELTAEKRTEWQKQIHKKEVLVYLPKFKMTCKFSLNEVLKAMGMPDAFSMNADFSGMDGSKELFISNVIHKAFVGVGEKGTEAAAATAVIVSVGCAPELICPPIFCADHPFIFLIKDNTSGSILFVGRVVDPTKE
nr:serpin family protein [Planctomycetota bacterium]